MFSNDSSEDVFIKEFKFYKKFNNFENDENSSILFLDKISETNFEKYNLKVFFFNKIFLKIQNLNSYKML